MLVCFDNPAEMERHSVLRNKKMTCLDAAVVTAMSLERTPELYPTFETIAAYESEDELMFEKEGPYLYGGEIRGDTSVLTFKNYFLRDHSTCARLDYVNVVRGALAEFKKVRNEDRELVEYTSIVCLSAKRLECDPFELGACLKEYREVTGKDTRFVSVAFAESQLKTADPTDPLMFDIAGFDRSTVDIIRAFCDEDSRHF